MTEAEAQAWVADRFGAAAVDRLAHFAQLLTNANEQQNLVAPATLPVLWSRHIADSAQLALLDNNTGVWLDIGSGGGLPGLVLALVLDRPFLLCEPRRLRASFLSEAAAALGLAPRVTVAQRKVEALATPAATISARAVASIEALFTAARACATPDTTWILPRGKSGRSELELVQRAVRGEFHVKQSLTDPEAVIVVARRVAKR